MITIKTEMVMWASGDPLQNVRFARDRISLL
jgi:hypothetical protein